MGEDTSEPSTPTQQQPPIIRFSKPKPRTEESKFFTIIVDQCSIYHIHMSL